MEDCARADNGECAGEEGNVNVRCVEVVGIGMYVGIGMVVVMAMSVVVVHCYCFVFVIIVAYSGRDPSCSV